MIDHLSLGVADLARAAPFYEAVLAALGWGRLWAHERAIGYGRPGASEEPFAIRANASSSTAPGEGFHLAFCARSRDEVHAFHAAALRLGGKDEGSPGLRPAYGDGYYAAFVRDPDGHRIEVVFHEAAP